MKSNDEKKLKTLEMEYNEIMNGFQNQNVQGNQTPQLINPNDFIVKFSLYQETPNSITSTDTLVNLAF